MSCQWGGDADISMVSFLCSPFPTSPGTLVWQPDAPAHFALSRSTSCGRLISAESPALCCAAGLHRHQYQCRGSAGKAGGGTVPFCSSGIFVGLFSFLENDRFRGTAWQMKIKWSTSLRFTSQESRSFLRFGSRP